MSNSDKEHAMALLAYALKGEIEIEQSFGSTALIRPPKQASGAGSEGLAVKKTPIDEAAVPAEVSVPQSPLSVARPSDNTESETPDLNDKTPLQILQHHELGNCTRCKLHRGRTQIVFGSGNENADLVFIGEGPGANEDRLGEPFVGKAGALLTKMIGAMNLSRDDVYICNVVKCRPPNNRDPEPDEVEACEPFLKAQLEILQPKVIVTLGKYAAQLLLKTRMPISKLRGEFASYEGIDVLPTFHPAYLLRSPDKKRDAWNDLKKVMARLEKLQK